SFTLTPMLSAWWGVEPHSGHGGGNRLTRAIAAFNRRFDELAERYRGIVAWALGHRRTTMLAAGGSLIAAFMLFPFIGGGFMPDMDAGEFAVTFETPEGSSIEYTRRKATEVVETLRGIEGVDYVYTTVGAGATGTVTQGNVYVSLVEARERELTQDEVMVEARQRLGSIYGVRAAVLDAGGVGGAQKPLQVNVRGPEV